MIEARFHSDCGTDIRENYVLLKRQGWQNGVDSGGGMATIHSGPGKHACQPVNATRNFFWIPYFGTVFKGKIYRYRNRHGYSPCR